MCACTHTYTHSLSLSLSLYRNMNAIHYVCVDVSSGYYVYQMICCTHHRNMATPSCVCIDVTSAKPATSIIHHVTGIWLLFTMYVLCMFRILCLLNDLLHTTGIWLHRTGYTLMCLQVTSFTE
jgi:hypothetical protein